MTKTLSHLRLISLCNVIYKIITKVMMNRLKGIMPWITSPNQIIFVSFRPIVNNIVIYQEVLHTLWTKRTSKGTMNIKIDFTKAYDRLS